MSDPIRPLSHLPREIASAGYIKLHIRARLPALYRHPAALYSREGRLLGLLFFFDAAAGSPRDRDSARREAFRAAEEIADQFRIAMVCSAHDVTGACTEELFVLEGRIDEGRARAA